MMLGKEYWKAVRERETAKLSEIPSAKIEHYRSLEIQTWESLRNNGATGYDLRIYHGESGRPMAYYYFRTLAQRETYITEAKESEDARETRKQGKRLARRNLVNPYKIGDIFSYSWGYDQTNIEFFEVIARTDKTITIRELKQTASETGWCQGSCMPIPGEFLATSKPMTKTIQASVYTDGTVRPYISMPFGCCSPWDGKPEHYTAYA